MIPANRAREIIVHLTLGILLMIKSANNDGIFDSINNETIPIVPAIIIMTFKSIALIASLNGRPIMINMIAEAKAIYALYLGIAIKVHK